MSRSVGVTQAAARNTICKNYIRFTSTASFATALRVRDNIEELQEELVLHEVATVSHSSKLHLNLSITLLLIIYNNLEIY